MWLTNGWIDVTDRLPEANGRYLVVLHTEGNIGFEIDKTEILIMKFNRVNGWRLPVHFPKEINDSLNQEVLYWQPLPDLPKKIYMEHIY